MTVAEATPDLDDFTRDVASAVVGLIAFILFKLVLGKQMARPAVAAS